MTVQAEPKPWMKDRKFTLVDDLDMLEKVVDGAIKKGKCAVDLETSGLDNRIDSNGKTIDNIVGYCLSFNGKEGFYVPVDHINHGQEGIMGVMSSEDQSKYPKPYDANINEMAAAEEIKRLCNNCVTIYHNSSFDLEFLYGSSANIQVEEPEMFEDTYILSYLRDPTQKRHGLKKLSNDRLGLEMIEYNDLFQGSTDESDNNFSKLDPTRQDVLQYTGSDAICTYLLHEDLKNIPEKEGMEYLYEIEKACVAAHRWMERSRPKLDREYLERLRDQIDAEVEEIKEEIYQQLIDILGFSQGDLPKIKEKYDVDSPMKLGKALAKMKEESPEFNVELEKTDSGQVATHEDAIEHLSEEYGDEFPFLDKIGTFRNLRKVNSTYVKKLLKGGDWSTGGEDMEGAIKDDTARFKFNPYGTDSGRFSASKGSVESGYSGINVQSIPGCYNAATFPVKKVHDRPDGPGEEDAELYEDYLYARDDQGLVRHEYDNHFIEGLRNGEEYCLRKSCEGCPFQEECDHDEEEERRFLSLGAAVRPAVVGDDDKVFAAIDYSGVEMRAAAELSDEETWKEEFIHGEGDGHKQTAKVIYGDDVVDKPDFKMYRQKAKCVVGDTLVQTNRGLVPIETLDPGSEDDEFVKFDDPVKVWTDGGVQEATHFYNGGVQKTVQITTDGRFTLEGSETHRIRVFDREEGYTWKSLGSIKEGDYVIIDRGGPVFNDEYEASIDPYYSDKETDQDNQARIPITEDWAYFMGIVTGDGTVQDSHIRITYDEREEGWENEFSSLIDRLGLKYNQRSTGENKATFTVCSRRLSRTFHRWGMKEKSVTASIPEVVLKSSLLSQRAFLRGLFDADGSINEHGDVRLHSSSKDLLNQVQTMLASHGVFGRIRLRHSDHPLTGKDYFDLCIGGVEAVRFGEEVGFSLKRKAERLKSGGETRDKIPFPEEHVASDCENRQLKRTRSREGLTYRMIDRHRDEYEFSDEVEWLRDRKVRFSKVKKIEEDEKQVYDLTVPSTSSFWANGFINHNSANFAILYGGGGTAIANSANISSDEGWEILNKMKKGIKSYNRWEKSTIQSAKKDKEVRTVLNRKIPLHKIDSANEAIVHAMERKATNSVIQGSATGDLIKYSMVATYNAIKEHGLEDDVQLLFAIHDELVFELKKDSLEETVPLIREKMTEFSDMMDWDVPVEVEVELGEVWDTPYMWEKFKEVKPESGLAKTPVPDFLRTYVDYKRGMWVEEGDERKIHDGTEFIPSDSPKYNWGMCHQATDKKPLMKRDFPKDWKDHILLHPGMWWRENEDDYAIYDGEKFHHDFKSYMSAIDSEEVVDVKDRVSLESNSQPDESMEQEDSDKEGESENELAGGETEEVRRKEREEEQANLPLFRYKVKANLNKKNGEYIVIRLRKILDFMEAYARKNNIEVTHEVDVLSPRGKSILPEDESFRIVPELFMLLVKYEGL